MHPLDFLTAGYVGGLLGGALPAPGGLSAPALAAAACLGLALAGLGMGSLRRAAPALLFVAAGAALAVAVPALHRWALPSHHLLRHIPRGRANAIGHLSWPIERRGRSRRRPRLLIEVERLVVRGVEVPARGTARITLASPLPFPLEVGDRLLVRGVRLRPPRRYLNPGGFDYREFLRLRSVHAVGFASARRVERLRPRERAAGKRALFRFRGRMRAHLRAVLPEEAAGLLEAMTLGVRGDLDRGVREEFQLAGAAHLLAISGLHVGFITVFFFLVLQALFRRLPPGAFPLQPVVMTPAKAASLAAIPIVILFALLTGARISTVRASIMVVIFLLTRVLERPGGALHSVFLAALLILAVEPGFIWDAGFQLSFVAVTFIILAARRLPRPGERGRFRERAWWRAWLIQFAGVQLVVSVAVTPLTAFHFHEVHPIGLLVNFLLIPVASLAVPLTFLVAAFAAAGGALVVPGIDLILAPADALLALLAAAMLGLVRLAARVPGGTLVVSPPGLVLIAATFAALALALLARRAALRRAGWAAVAGALVLTGFPPSARPPAPTGRTTLILPDAGRSDAFFLRLPDGRGIAVDGRGERRSGFNPWIHVVAPLLRRLGETRWEVLFSPPARGRAPNASWSLAADLHVGRILEPGGPSGGGPASPRGEAGPRVLWRARAGGARLRLLDLGGGRVGYELLHPPSRWLIVTGRNARGFDAAALAGRGYDLIRLPEGLLAAPGVLAWLERERPRALIAAPGRMPWPRPKGWLGVLARQRALGVYRPWRGGMVRAVSGEEGRMERYAMAGPWPDTSPGRWLALRPAPGAVRFGGGS